MIYFIKPVGMAGPIKIGFTTNSEKRLEGLTVWSPFKLEIMHTVPGDIKLEMKVHAHFADLHSHHEWFHPGERLVSAIKRMKAGLRLEDAIDLSDRRGNITARPDWTPERRNRLSYTSRIQRALWRFSQDNGHVRCALPARVQQIVASWSAQKGLACRFLSAEDYAHLDAFLKDPAKHIVILEKAA